MADALVFHLMKMNAGRLFADVVLRYAHDPRCSVERGDVWERTATNGEVTNHRVMGVRTYWGVDGEETHAFMAPIKEITVQ
ncbi:hypothetical protein A3H16_01890 [Candidatus Kaiserbacteria bacterium RIFCSPLOWO2_12_FULL_53_8]|uniref:Uncharacterized protein n=2 Tax=Candidatus Kaiseribacteriota TaxID=1752734 RepID=A0A1F6CWP4_9BACT|nr:MAG: hypothetical protein A2851_04075 [Candidatus Kaiserbacteria bacterium RIFCSPHIGHO2_01_FULL_53_29]OGG91875.1 MAG: hypothetical protein A3H16_01890 [Candidatus Kaiserbacteria bacterium RIFCSPLOWO2_12_FULL_53_8]